MALDFVSVTYWTGGSTRQRTAEVSGFLKSEFGYTVMPHLTCVGHSRAELNDIADRIHADGFRNIMALRGDPTKGAAEFTAAADGLRNADELVSLLAVAHALVRWTRDDLVPPDMAGRLAAAANSRVGGGHNDVFETGGAPLWESIQASVLGPK